MPTFRVFVRQYVEEVAEVLVDAETGAEAENKVAEAIANGECDLDWCDGCDIMEPEVTGSEHADDDEEIT